MGKAKKIGIGIGVAFAVLIGLGILGSIASNNNPTTETQNPISSDSSSTTPISDTSPVQDSSSSNDVITKSVVDMLPTRNDVGTEWRISPMAYNNTSFEKGYLGNSNVAPMVDGTIAVGYEDGVTQDYTTEAVVKVAIATFDSQNNAKAYHSSITNKLYNEGGFKQIDTNSINADCFSAVRELDLTTISNLYCVKENVYYSVKEVGSLYTYSEDVKETTINFAKIIANKITAKLASAQQLGSLSFTTFTEKVCNGSDGCATSIALANHDVSACDTLTNNNGCISAYAIKFDEPENCSNATNSLDCFKTVSLSLGSSVCGLTDSESDRVECGKYYITTAQLQDHYSSDEIREVCSPAFPHLNFLVQQVACKIEQLNLEDISKTDLLSWKTDDELTVCTPFGLDSVGENKDDYCLASIGVYLKDLSVCDQAGDARAECYGFVAVTEDYVDLDTCDRLEGTGNTFCYMHVAYRLNDISICDKADTNKENCIRLVNSKSA